MSPEIISSSQNKLGECPIWHPLDQQLYWLDVFDQTLYIYDTNSHLINTVNLPYLTGCIAPHGDGGLIAGMGNAIVHLDPHTAEFDIIAELFDQNESRRINDGKCDPAGRFWLGTVSTDFHSPNGKLYCLDTDGTLRVMQTKIGISNGLDWDLSHNCMYYSDSGKDCSLWRFDYDVSTAIITNRKKIFPHAAYPDAIIDGLTLDTQGRIWAAVWEGSCIVCLSPEGELLHQIQFDTPRITSCIFGGRQLDTLYVTSCAQNTEAGESQPLPAPAGAVFHVDVDARGTPMHCYGLPSD